jgi:selenocysteine lyase/cysteine desulfurase
MTIARRNFLTAAALGVPAVRSSRAALPTTPFGATPSAKGDAPPAQGPMSWSAVRDEFLLSREHIHLALMLLASHPRPVREAIERHRRAFDENPAGHFEERFFQADGEVRAAAARYMGGAGDDIALTDSTTMSLAVLYRGLPLRPGQEVVTTNHDHYATHENLRLCAARNRVTVRKVALYDQPAAVSEDEATRRLITAVGPRTRAVAVTWVHSSTGVKLPIRRFATALEELNRKRGEADRVLLCVDGVHGFGVERESPLDLGCDFFAAGCHKWIFGPRGTGVLWGRPSAWKGHTPVIASFERAPYEAWMKGQIPSGPPGAMASPGGFHSFEHRWSLGEAFAFHERIGRARVTARIHELARQCKEGLARMPHVKMHTPMSETLSAGLVCFEVKGVAADEVIKRLHARKIIASVTPYATAYARLSPGILNTPEEIDTVLREVRTLG